MAKQAKIRIQDIAREAGVSVTTASFYINGKAKKYKIAEKTCERIEAVIQKHNFIPNIYAKAIQSNKTFLVGLIVPGSVNKSFWIDIIAGIEEVISKEQYHLILSLSHFNSEQEFDAFNFMRTKGVDAYIFSPVANGDLKNKELIASLAEEKPVICIAMPGKNVTSVYNDNAYGGQLVADFLYDKGHRQIAYIGPMGQDKRGNCFIQTLKKKKITVKTYKSAADFFKNRNDVTAVFCFSDYELLTVYQLAEKEGVKIPDDLSVIGYDNMDFTEFLTPRPTTVNQYKKELGLKAGESLLEMLADKSSKKINDIVFKPFIIEGKSVKALN